MTPSFIFGGNAPAKTPQEAARNRAVYEAIVSRFSTPKDVGSGLDRIGQSLIAKSMLDRATAGEEAGAKRVSELVSGFGDGADMNELIGAVSDPWLADSPGGSMVAQALLQREMKKGDPDWQTFESGGDMYRWNANDPNSTPGLFFDGPDAPLAAPKTDSIYDEATGRDRKVQWNAATGKWEDLGGVSAPKEPLVSVNTGDGSTAYNKKLDEYQAQRYLDFQKESEAGQRALSSFEAMKQAMADPAFYSGAGGEQVLGLKRLGAALGIDPAGIQSAEAFNALSKQAALDVMGGSLGTGFSNADRDFVIQQVANLGNTPEGNRAIIEIQSKLATRKIEIAQLATTYAKTHGQLDEGFDDELRRFAEANPLFPAPADTGATLKRITSDAEFDALPSGSEFIDPEGKRRRKP